jgi:hypothetical protein
MNATDVKLWLETVLGGLAGWINLRAIDDHGARSTMVATTGEAEAWCQRHEGQRANLYAGLARRGEVRDADGKIDASEKNLAGCQVVWADLDSGTREDQLARLDAFPIAPSLVVDSGGGTHALWKLDDPIECASDPTMNAKLRRILRGIQVTLGGDRAVCDAARIFRIAGTMNYPNAKKRALGRVDRMSSIVRHSPYTVVLEDFDDFEIRGTHEEGAQSVVHGHGEMVPPAVELILQRVPRMRAVFYCERRLEGKSASDEDFAIAAGLIRHAPWLRDADLVAALRYRRVALAHLVKGSHKTDSYYSSTIAKAKARLLDVDAAPDFDSGAARWFQWALRRAVEPRKTPEVDPEAAHRELPKISTGIPLLDEATGGGLYGFTALAGDSGVGKSTVALNTALVARRGGWDVLYVAAEMSQADYELRSARFLGCEVAALPGHMPTFAHIADGLDLGRLMDLVMTFPTDATKRLLIVLDSMTKAAAFIDQGREAHSFFDAMAKLTRLCEGAVRFGEQRIAVIATSELNRDREALGRRITYAASLQVNLMADKSQPDLVQISIAKGRYSAKRAPFGPFLHDWRQHRMRLLGEVAQPQHVERDGWHER